MNEINTIDLWTEQKPNHIECIHGAFIDGFAHNEEAFDSFKVVTICKRLYLFSNMETLMKMTYLMF